MNVSNPVISIAPAPETVTSTAAPPPADKRRTGAPVTLVGPLSPREGQVIGLIDAGLTSKEAAFQLGVSDATVRVLISRALRKLGRPRRRRA